MKTEIAVWVKRPGQIPEQLRIRNSLRALQRTVDGYIEAVRISEDIVVICIEEGRILGLPENCRVCGHTFVGTIVFAGLAGEDFDDAPDREVMCDFLPGIFGGEA